MKDKDRDLFETVVFGCTALLTVFVSGLGFYKIIQFLLR